MRTIHLRINDAATQQPTPVRLRVADADGRAYPPHGRFETFPTGRGEDVGGQLWLGREAYWPIDGACELALPEAVPLTIQAHKGPEYRPIEQSVTLSPGQMTLRYVIERLANPTVDGWFAGDGRALALSPHDARLEGAAEGLAFVNLLAAELDRPSPREGRTYRGVPNLTAFSGQGPALPTESSGCVVAVNTYNTHPTLGQLALWHTHRPIFPLTFGELSDDWSLSDWCDQAHRKRGLVVWAEPQLNGEALACALLGQIDAIELTPTALAPRVWARLAAVGVRLPLVGSSGKDSNCLALGAMRTYAHIPSGEPWSYGQWVESVREGRTVVTTGPLLQFSADNLGPGESLSRSVGALVHLAAEAKSARPFARLQLLAGTAVVAEKQPILQEGVYQAWLELDYPVEKAGWLTARCLATGPDQHGITPFAQATPVWLDVNGQRPFDPASAAELVRALGQTRDWVTSAGRYDRPQFRERLLERLTEAERRLLAANTPS